MTNAAILSHQNIACVKEKYVWLQSSCPGSISKIFKFMKPISSSQSTSTSPARQQTFLRIANLLQSYFSSMYFTTP